MTNKIQSLITEINRAQKTRKTMKKRLNREEEILIKAKKALHEMGIRPYHKRNASN